MLAYLKTCIGSKLRSPFALTASHAMGNSCRRRTQVSTQELAEERTEPPQEQPRNEAIEQASYGTTDVVMELVEDSTDEPVQDLTESNTPEPEGVPEAVNAEWPNTNKPRWRRGAIRPRPY